MRGGSGGHRDHGGDREGTGHGWLQCRGAAGMDILGNGLAPTPQHGSLCVWCWWCVWTAA